jgi:DNA-binding MarR family transcriptional regulator
MSKEEPIRNLVELDKLVHEPRRFGIMNALNRTGDLGLNTLRRITGLTQGNLATHLRKLEDAGLIEIRRRTILRRPYSRVFITDEGRAAITSHWQRLNDLEKEVARWLPADVSADDDLSSEEYAALSPEDRARLDASDSQAADNQS